MNQTHLENQIIYVILAYYHEISSRDELINLFKEWMSERRGSFADLLKNKGLLSDREIILLSQKLKDLRAEPGSRTRIQSIIDQCSGLVQELIIRTNNESLASLSLLSNQFFVTSISCHSNIGFVKKSGQIDLGFESSTSSPSDAELQLYRTKIQNVSDHNSGSSSFSSSGNNSGDSNHNSILFSYETCFETTGFVARGAIGEVYQANDTGFARNVALKKMQQRDADRLKEQLRATFLLEGEVTGRLDHPGVLPMYGLGQTRDGNPFYVMKYIDTPDFESLINQFHGTTSGDTTATVISNEYLRKLLSHFSAACQTLQYAHDRGVLHCDVKPANIMTGRYGETYVVDWGMALLFKVDQNGEIRSSHHFVEPIQPVLQNSRQALHRDQGGMRDFIGGTLGYMSPEHYQANRESRVSGMTPAADIFSMGAILYQILTGVMPVNARPDESMEQRLGRIAEGRFESASSLVSGIPRPLDAICRKAMASNPAMRYENIKDLATDIEKWQAGEPVSAYSETLLERGYRWANRNRTAVLSSVTALIVILVGVFIMAFIEKQNRLAIQAKNMELVFEHRQAMINAEEASRQRIRVEEREKMRIRSEKILIATINRYIKDVTNHPELKSRPDLESLRIDLLKGPLEYYIQIDEELQNTPDTSDESMSLLAEGYTQLGNLIAEIGQKYDSLAAFEKSIVIFERLLKSQPDNTNFQFGYVRALQRAGDLNRIRGDVKLSELTTEKAYKLINQMIEKTPGDLKLVNEQADIEDDLAVTYRATGRSEKARELFQKAVAKREILVNSEPGKKDFQLDLATSYRMMGIALQDIGRNQEARENYLKYLNIIQNLSVDNPESWNYQSKLSDAYLTMGIIEQDLNNTKNARDYYSTSRSLLKDHLAESPVDPASEKSLAFVLSLLASLDEENLPSIAIENYLKSVIILRSLVKRFPSVASYQANLSTSLKGAGIAEINQKNLSSAKTYFLEALKVQQHLHDLHPEQADTEAGIGDILEKLATVETSGEYSFELLLRAIENQSRALKRNNQFQMFQAFMVNHWNTIITKVSQTIDPESKFNQLLKLLPTLKELFPGDGSYDLIMKKLNLQQALFYIKNPGGNTDQYTRGLNITSQLSDLKDPSQKIIRAIANYRNKRYLEVIDLLSDQFGKAQANEGSDNPVELAFLAMSLFRQEKFTDAKKVISKLDELMQESRFMNDADSRDAYEEAKRLIKPLSLPESPFQN